MGVITEELLHFLWNFQYFNKSGLAGTQNEKIVVLKKGIHNTNSGPDFLDTHIFIDDVEWHGSVEIHCYSSEWKKHNHQYDAAYNTVVLHVVYEHDRECYRQDGTRIPVLELKDRVSLHLLQQYHDLMANYGKIPCEAFLKDIPSIIYISQLQRAMVQRLERKAHSVLEVLTKNKMDWEETAYQLFVKSFGSKVNQDAFFQLSQSVPFSILKKQSNSIFQLEALLFGVAGLIPCDSEDSYITNLSKEYSFLKSKYGTVLKEMNQTYWKFSRIRPAHFPTVRLAQLASILVELPHLFSTFLSIRSPREMDFLIKVMPSLFWQQHYTFQKKSTDKIGGIGREMMHNILINVVVPLLAAYAIYTQDSIYMEQAVFVLEKMPSEKNSILEKYKSLNFSIHHAFDSQAVLELDRYFCSQKKCLQCMIGSQIFKKNV